MVKTIVLILISTLTLSFSECSLRLTGQDKNESEKIDSLITTIKINDKAAIIKFGYDAVTAVNSSEGIILVDAGISTCLTGRYVNVIKDIFGQKKVVYVINSHYHTDHISGNSLFPGAQIAGHENFLKDIPEDLENRDSAMARLLKIVGDYDLQLQNLVPNSIEWRDSFTQKIRYRSAYLDVKNNIRLRLPDITFSDSIILRSGDITFELKYFGKFHSNSDILIYIPEMKILFIGDLFSKYGRPSMYSSSMTLENSTVQAVKWINKRINSIDAIIGGHGPLLSIDDLKSFNDRLL